MILEQSGVLIEVCLDAVSSAIAAERGGASRIELCAGLIEGGITPSTGTIESVRAAVSLPLHVMVRPRAGDFCYDCDEFDTMRRDIACAKNLGANGVVFGILDPHGNIDIERTRELVSLARPLPVTFHRAFDMTNDLFRALEDVCQTGVDRVLTSGGEPTAPQGSATITRLVEQAKDRCVIMAGSGIKAENARIFVKETGVKEVHVGLRTRLPSPMIHQNAKVVMGTLPGREYQRFAVLQDDVQKLRAALSDLNG